MDYAKDIYKVASKLKNFTALEIGAAWGLSTLAILEAGAKHLTSVDPNVMAQGHNEAVASGYKNHVWTAIRSDRFWEQDRTCFDLIYVDGSHLYEDIRNDLYQAWDRLNPDGLLMVDDWEHKNNRMMDGNETIYGVSLACWEFWRDHKPKDVGINGRVLWFKK